MFKVGDRVEYIGVMSATLRGHRGTVTVEATKSYDPFVQVDWDDDDMNTWYSGARPENLKLVEQVPELPKRTRVLQTTSEERKQFPMARGLLDYFPDALAEVAKVSYLGNQKHNPGEPMHHARGKSMDHADCIVRHLVGRGGFDGDTRESAALAWRALALLQEELEAEMALPLPRGAKS
jgi:hypothetical protein